METPNTRARRKREIESAAAHDRDSESSSSVVWGRDELLLREFMLSGPSDIVPLPAPTQRARPIIASTSAGTGTGAGAGASHPRKRSRIRSASVLPRAEETGRRIDDLLERYMDAASASSRPGSCASTPNTSTTNTNTNTSSLSTSTSASSARSLRQPMADRQVNRSQAQAQALTSSRSMPPKYAPTLLSNRRTLSATDLKAPHPHPHPHPQRFRPPFLHPHPNPHPPRSSPCRTVAMAASPLRSLAASPLPLPRPGPKIATSHQPPSQQLRQSPRQSQARSRACVTAAVNATRAVPVLPVLADVQPSSDGDTSIDSFDGFFENGGVEVDDLFAAMDGK